MMQLVTAIAYMNKHTSACACRLSFLMLEESGWWVYIVVAQRDYAEAQSHFKFKFKELSDAYLTFSLHFPDPLLQNMNTSWEV